MLPGGPRPPNPPGQGRARCSLLEARPGVFCNLRKRRAVAALAPGGGGPCSVPAPGALRPLSPSPPSGALKAPCNQGGEGSVCQQEGSRIPELTGRVPAPPLSPWTCPAPAGGSQRQVSTFRAQTPCHFVPCAPRPLAGAGWPSILSRADLHMFAEHLLRAI